MTINEQEEYLIEETKKYANAFLYQLDGFLPFAIFIDNNDELFFIERDDNAENLSAEELIALFEDTFQKEMGNEKSGYQMGSICLDISIQNDENEEDAIRDALDIRLIAKTSNKNVIQFYSRNQKGDVFFEDLVSLD